ncbi:hypothetical protein HG536_0B01240 [Torulaspora globosa]|uniref:Restriction of telomere capping protein 4 n=1 Tax=Torulaspora globosa TaxID=48254 RepID=A0A7G3ZCM7_9SACH|nr:uncharacterized protein HG536_0B01240 [Torulaspora globosa]QLL31263.1 hypothetical protein HG536_0B01240 [Torulaspora globosa]
MTARKALKSKRNLVYSTREDRDEKLQVFKRRRAAIFQQRCTGGEQAASDGVSGGTERRVVGRRRRSAKSRALQAIAAGEDSDSSSDAGRASSEGSEPLVNLRQSIAPEDIEEIKKQNSKGVRSVGDLIEKCEHSMEYSSRSPADQLLGSSGDKGHVARKLELRRKYEQKFALPSILYRSELIMRIQPFLRLVEDLFKNRVSSYYKHEAASASKASNNAFLSLDEFRSMDISRFVAGYYGLRRQLSVGEEILRQFRPFLLKRQGKTMKWWGVADFANYVLAPEVLASFCIDEMQLGDDIYDRETREKAYELFHNTTEFGLAIADAEPLEQWEAPVRDQRATGPKMTESQR